MGWIATLLSDYPAVRPSGLGLCLTMATHCDHATNMSISSQQVLIVESMALRRQSRHERLVWLDASNTPR
jgi:hypothetical protein